MVIGHLKWLNPFLWIGLLFELMTFIVENGFESALDLIEKSK